ncbi:uncharacterized protein KY384_006359 [Bacidia gigantensis]|uniref:uncharacterized protein n=1 Tax=Bacidia gigantensis TaxID=2732470 RepID=UPI001D040FE4|nr:uncharacterized protein KY384_006359 [Bacidia gigantensis]KAG8528672.1 hypothetical protein KY384_006359 [Bacidia gigantensis]
MPLWTPETGGHIDFTPSRPKRRDTATHPPIPTHPVKPRVQHTHHASSSLKNESIPESTSPTPPSNPTSAPSHPPASAPSTANGVPGGYKPSTTLFPPSLLPSAVIKQLPEKYTMRPLQPSDYSKGHLDVLKNLTSVGEISEAAWLARWSWMKRRNDDGFPDGGAEPEEKGDRGGGGGLWKKAGSEGGKRGEYFVIVILDGEGRVVGTGAVVVERKFIHNLGLVGHIEDIVVSKDQQGKKLGLRIIEALDAVAKEVGCYKTILDCSEANEGFYVKCGYKRAGLEMAHYYNK